MRKVISVFGSSRPREGEPEYLEAREVGKALALEGFVVCNGGYGGIMEASARGAKEAGGETIGVTVDTFTRTANRWIDREIRKATLPERIAVLVDSADGYVILKGGTGTLLELAYVWEFINKKFVEEKPIVIVGDFWTRVVETLKDELLWEGLGDCTRFVQRVATPEECAALLKRRLLKSRD
ncbi:MAG: LOG family protein [Ignavibacteriales bacterium]|nr:LOG family protein [Ignavibacteriales bacterium]